MAVVDLSAAGSQEGTLNGAIFTDTVFGSSGTGVLDSFVRVSDNTPVTEGYNSSFRPVEFDEDTSPVRNRDLPLSSVPIVIINGVAYREFLLDTNESTTNTLLSLNRVEIYQTNVEGITDYPFVGTATKVYDMDAGTAGIDTAPPSPNGNWVLLNGNEPAGSGTANMFLYVPNALFGAGEFVVLYSRFGDTIAQDAGFEEWAVREAEDVFSISGRKFNDLDGDHTDDLGTDPGLPGWTIYIDANDNGVRDAGEPFTTTGADGTYSLVGVAAGTYIVCEEPQAGWQQTFPVVGDDCHTVILTDADATGIDFGNQLIAPAINIEKLVNGDDADTAPGPSLPVGSTATFTYLITNPGNVPISNVVVVDDNGTPGNLMDDFMPMFTGGDTLANGLLDPGETWTYTATKIVTLGLFTNIGAVTGTSSQGQVTDNDPANHTGIVVAAPDVDIEKFVNGDDADLPTGPFLAVGSTATFTYLVSNTGNVNLTSVSVLDDQGLTPIRGLDQVGNNDNVLNPGEVWVFTASVIVTPGQYTNIGSVTADSSQGPVTDSDPANHFGVLGGIDVEKLVNGQDADTPPGPGLEVGSTATFTYIVTNTGNVPLANVAVIDDNGTPGNTSDDFAAAFVGGDTDMDGLLDLNETWTFSAIRVVTLGLHTNVGTVTGQTPLGTTVTESDVANHVGLAAAIDIEKLVNGQDADAPTGPLLAVGSTATFTYLVTNTGAVPLTNVVVIDDNGTPGILADDFLPTFTGGDTNPNGILDPGETWTYTAARIVTPGQYTNFGTVIANSSQTVVSDSDQANHFGVQGAVDIEKLVNGQDADTPTGPLLAVGSTATFTYLVTNTGNVDLTNVSVVDDQGLTPIRGLDQVGNNDNVLNPGEVWRFMASVLVTPGQYTNIGTATGQTPLNTTVSDSDPANHFGVLGTVDIEKLVNGQDADTPTGPLLAVGSTATFTYLVTNTGNVDLTNVSVVDDQGLMPIRGLDPVGNNDNVLSPGEVWAFTASALVTPGQYTNIGTVTAQTPLQATVTDSDPANHFGVLGAIDVEKLVNGLDADTPPGPLVEIGSTVTFTYVVTNPGNVPLENVNVVDDNGTPLNPADDFMPMFVGGDTIANGLLDPTETWTFTAARIATLGLHTNLGTVSGQTPLDTTVTDSDTGNHTGFEPAVPGVDIEKLVNGEDADLPTGPFLAVGSTATFTYLVNNTGNVALTNVSVVDDQGLMPARQADQSGNNDNVLDPDEVWVFTASAIVTPGQYTNIGTVTADTGEGPVTDSDPANHFGVLAAIDIEKLVNGQDADTPPGPVLDVGSIATFTYIVTNPGNVPLSNVVVIDDNGTPGVPADDFMPAFVGGDVNMNSLLDPTETWTYTAMKVVTLGQYTNVGTVTAQTPLETTVTDSDTGNFFGVPMIVTPDKTSRSLPFVHLVDPTTGDLLSSFLAYDINYRGGVRVATGDVTGDGIPEIITAPGRNLKPIVKIFSLDGTLLEEFLAYSATFKGGLDLAVGDVNNDGQNDIVTAMNFAGNQVKVFKNPNGTLSGAPTPFHSSFNFGTTSVVAKHLVAFSPFGTFTGGASVEVADMGTVVKSGTTKILNTTLDGKPELIVANEAGMRSTVYVYGFLPALTAATTTATPFRLRTYLPFTSTFRGGLSLDVARVNELDQIPDIIVGAKSLGASQVLVLNGASTSTVVLNGFVAFSAGDTPSFNAPVNVTAFDQDRDGRAEFILASQGSDGSFARIRKFDSLTGTLVDELLEQDFDPLAVDHFFGAYFSETIKL